LSDISFRIGYHKDQGIYAPFKKSGAVRELQATASSLIFRMQKELSEWINVSNIEINDKVAEKINKSFTEE
jgi:hypothetical protein